MEYLEAFCVVILFVDNAVNLRKTSGKARFHLLTPALPSSPVSSPAQKLHHTLVADDGSTDGFETHTFDAFTNYVTISAVFKNPGESISISEVNVSRWSELRGRSKSLGVVEWWLTCSVRQSTLKQSYA